MLPVLAELDDTETAAPRNGSLYCALRRIITTDLLSQIIAGVNHRVLR